MIGKLNNKNIIEKVKNSLQDKVLKGKENCSNCKSKTEFKLYLKDGIAKCQKCKQAQPITDQTYIDIYNLFK